MNQRTEGRDQRSDQKQNQFFAPLSETGGVGLCSTGILPVGTMGVPPVEILPNPHIDANNARFEARSEASYSGWPASEPCVVISESAVRALVAAIDNNRPHKAALIIKSLPWFAEILSGVRATRHLHPVSYIKLSERPCAMHDGCRAGIPACQSEQTGNEESLPYKI